MKQRIISAMVGLLILAVVLFFYDTLVLNLAMCFISVVAVTELLHATGSDKVKPLAGISILLTLVIPFARADFMAGLLLPVIFTIILLFFVVFLRHHTKLRFEKVAMAFLFSTFVPLFFSCAVYMRDDFGAVAGGFYLILALGSAWLCDTCAYFTGVFFGKRKMAPLLSPKKTVEGAVGGIVFGMILNLLLAWGYGAFMGAMGYPVKIEYLLLALCCPVLEGISMLGDLSASGIKRQFGVKDYGNIMPGHGGIMDRFDSVLFTLPAVFVLARQLPLISLV